MNPPHILIARNSRGPNSANPSASLSSPTETHAAAAGIFRSAGSPPWYLEECESDEMVSALSLDGDYEDPIEIDETFTENSRFPGTVKIIVESTTFWYVHATRAVAAVFIFPPLTQGHTRRCCTSRRRSSRPPSVGRGRRQGGRSPLSRP